MLNIKSIKINFNKKLKSIYSSEEINSIWNQWIIKELLKMKPIQYLVNQEIVITQKSQVKINLIIEHLLSRKPIQYFFGYSYFKGLKFLVNNHVLIPRPETEELVDHVLAHVKDNKIKKIIDIGTGSGCISIALKKKLNVDITAVDHSEKALNIASKNAQFHRVSIDFKLIDILDISHHQSLPKVDLIVSNPPYVLKKEVPLGSIVLSEPFDAIFVNEEDPFVFYKAICQFAKENLNQGGKIFFEINSQLVFQLIEVIKLLGFSCIEIRHDFFEKKRFIIVSS